MLFQCSCLSVPATWPRAADHNHCTQPCPPIVELHLHTCQRRPHSHTPIEHFCSQESLLGGACLVTETPNTSCSLLLGISNIKGNSSILSQHAHSLVLFLLVFQCLLCCRHSSLRLYLLSSWVINELDKVPACVYFMLS